MNVSTEAKSVRKKFRLNSVKNFITDTLRHPLFKKPSPLAHHHYEPGDSKLVVITGENATGKSVLRKLVSAAVRAHEHEAIALSMQARRSSEVFVGMIYGDESCFATGSNSGHTITTAISTSRKREGKHAIIWDEPDLGLSDNYAAGAGLEIVEFIQDAPKNLLFAITITHRRALLRALQAAKPHHIRLGDQLTLEEVLAAPVKPERLQVLYEKNIETFRTLGKKYSI